MAGSVDEEEEGDRKRRIRNLASTSINLHLLVRALPCLRRAFHHREGALPPTSELAIISMPDVANIILRKLIFQR